MKLKTYVVFWNQENNMGFSMLPFGKSSLRVNASDQSDACEKALIILSQMIPCQYEYMRCNGKVAEDGSFYIEIVNTEENDFIGKIFDFKALETTL